MMNLLPAPVHRAALRGAHLARLCWWSMRRPTVRGCNAIVANSAGEVLLVRHSYQASSRWMLPGGGLGRSERAEDAATREVLEETGCRISDAHHFADDSVPLLGATNLIALVRAVSEDLPKADGREILEARFFPSGRLPEAISPAARKRIETALAHFQNRLS